MPLPGRRGAPVDWLIVGLGQPRAPSTPARRHNVGFEVANVLRARWELPKAEDASTGAC